MDGWPYVGGGAFCRPVGCADPFPMPGRDRDFSARRVLAMRAILSPPRKLWNIRRLAVAASGRGSMAHPPRKSRPLPLWSHFPPHPPNSVQLPHAPVYGTGLVCVEAGKGTAFMRVMHRNAASTKPHFLLRWGKRSVLSALFGRRSGSPSKSRSAFSVLLFALFF